VHPIFIVWSGRSHLSYRIHVVIRSLLWWPLTASRVSPAYATKVLGSKSIGTTWTHPWEKWYHDSYLATSEEKTEMVLLHCEMFRATCLAMFWRHCGGTSYTKQFHSVTFPATAKSVARQVARKVGLYSTFGNGSCNFVSQQFWPLQGLLHCEIFLATCPATASPRHCETSCTEHFFTEFAA